MNRKNSTITACPFLLVKKLFPTIFMTKIEFFPTFDVLLSKFFWEELGS